MNYRNRKPLWLMTGLVLLAASLFYINPSAKADSASPPGYSDNPLRGYQDTVASLSSEIEIAFVATRVAPLVVQLKESQMVVKNIVGTAQVASGERKQTDHPWRSNVVIDIEATATGAKSEPKFKPVNLIALNTIAFTFTVNQRWEVISSRSVLA